MRALIAYLRENFPRELSSQFRTLAAPPTQIFRQFLECGLDSVPRSPGYLHQLFAIGEFDPLGFLGRPDLDYLSPKSRR
jgi:hypothetical protein